MKAKGACIHPSKMLHLAIEAGDLKALEAALKRGADPNEFLDGIDMNPLSKVLSYVRDGKAHLIDKLMEHGALPGLSNAHGNTAFMRACMRGDVSSADAMMKNTGCAQLDILHRDNHGWMYSMAAVCEMPPEFLQRLQDRFESIHWKQNPQLTRNHLWTAVDLEEKNAMMIAKNKPASLQWLLNHPHLDMKSHLEQRCSKGRTVLWHAAEEGNSTCVSILLNAGASTIFCDYSGKNFMENMASISKFSGIADLAFGKMGLNLCMNILKPFHAAQEARCAIDHCIMRSPTP